MHYDDQNVVVTYTLVSKFYLFIYLFMLSFECFENVEGSDCFEGF